MSNLDRRDSGDVAGGGGSGGGVTPAELQAAVNTRVAKTGDTMTGVLTAPVARGRITNTYGGFSLKYGDLAVTKISTGLYSITFSTADPRKLMFFPESTSPVTSTTAGASGTSELTLRMWDQAGALTNAVGELYIWI